MVNYEFNKGLGKTVEFKGLQAQYLFIFAVGIVGLFLFFIVLNVIGVPVIVNLFISLVLLLVLLLYVFSYNKKYGQYGLMQLQALNQTPKFIISRKSIFNSVK